MSFFDKLAQGAETLVSKAEEGAHNARNMAIGEFMGMVLA